MRIFDPVAIDDDEVAHRLVAVKVAVPRALKVQMFANLQLDGWTMKGWVQNQMLQYLQTAQTTEREEDGP